MEKQEEPKISLNLAVQLYDKGYQKPSKLFWYTDIEEVGEEEFEEEARLYMRPAYSSEELDEYLPNVIEVSNVTLCRYYHTEYDSSRGEEVFKVFYGKNESDNHPYIVTSSTRSLTESKGLMVLELLGKGIIN